MNYSTDNLLISLNRKLAESLRAFGYDVRWFATGEVETHTAGGEAKGTVTLVPDFPANPTYIVRLNDGGSPGAEEIAVPAFALRLDDSPERGDRAGIGESVFYRERTFEIDGFAADDFQQRELMDFFYEWLQIGDVYLPVWDYSTDPDNPTSLEPLEVWRAYVEKENFLHEIEAIRYYIRIVAIVRYVE